MNAGHAVGAALGTVLSVVVLKWTGWKLTDSDALILGGAVLSTGAGVAHLIQQVGISGLLKVLWKGKPKPQAVVPGV